MTRGATAYLLDLWGRCQAEMLNIWSSSIGGCRDGEMIVSWNQLCSAGFCQGRSKKSTRQTEKETTSWLTWLDETQPFSMAQWSDICAAGWFCIARFSPQFPEDFRDLCLAADAHDPDWEAHCLIRQLWSTWDQGTCGLFWQRIVYSLDAKCWL
jgi:hypothetical protein